MQLSDYLALVRRNWLLIAALIVLGGSLGLLVAIATPARYESSTQQYVSVSNSGAAVDLAQSTSYARQAVTSYVGVVPTALVLSPVIGALDLDETVHDLAGRVTASAAPNSQLITITVTDADPNRAAQIANAVATSFADAVSDELERPVGVDSTSRVRVETVASARVPLAPSAPNLPLNVTLGLLLGLAVGIGGAALRTALDTRVHTAADVEAATGAPLLGGIAYDPDAAERPLIVHAAPRDPRAEAFRRLRTNLQFFATDAQPPVFVVTSAAPAEGKSTTTANTALTLAETGARVALIDADLRKPRVAEIFGIEGAVGLSDVLAGRVRLSDVIQPWGTGKLFLLPAGTIPPNAAELLGSAAMGRLLDELSSAFDYVLIDAPPLLAVTDAAVLARRTTGAILVAAAGSSRIPQLENAIKSLTNADARLLGAVITKVPTRGADSYGYGHYAYAAVAPVAAS